MAIPGNLLSPTTEMVDPNTSGWAPKLNCALSLGSGGRNGPGCLTVKSLAAGEMQARTFSSYAVSPGELYWTFADASASTQPERIGIRWLSASGAELGVTWSLTTAAASATWHRVSVAGMAPAGTARAQVVLSSIVSGAGVTHFWENVYLGYPLRLPGNLLSFNGESGGELDLSAWSAEANTTLTRVAPVAAWAASFYYAGGEQVSVAATAAGSASAVCVERPPVAAGTEYTAFAYLNPPTTGSSCWTELRFYDAAGTQLSASRGVLAAPGTGWYRQIASGIAPAGAATASVAVGITGATAGQAVRSEGVFLGLTSVAAESTQRTDSVLPQTDWDFEQGIGSWWVASGPATLARSTPWGAQAIYDAYSLTISSTSAATSVVRTGLYPVGDAEGQNWRVEVFTKVSTGAVSFDVATHWYDADGVDLGVETAAPVALAPGWWGWTNDAVAPAGAAQARVECTVIATAANSTLQIDRPALWQALPQTDVEAEPATASTRLVLRELPVGQLLTVWRIGPDGARTPVRGQDGLYDGVPIVSDSMVIEDYEPPLGVPVYYRITVTPVSDGSTLATRTSDSVTVQADDPGLVWLTDPARPGIGVRLLVKEAPAWQQPIEQTVFRVRGRSTPVIRSDVRGSREGSLVGWTTSDEQREALRFLLSTGNVLLWRTAPGMGESDVYVSVAETAFPRIVTYAPEPWREWTLPLTEVDMPTGGQAGSATWTVHDVVVENATGYDVLDRYASVFDLTTHIRRA